MLQQYAPIEDLRKYADYVEKCVLLEDYIQHYDSWVKDHYGEYGVPYEPVENKPENPWANGPKTEPFI